MKNAWLDNLRTRRRRGEVALPEDSGEHPAVSPVDTEASLWSVSEAMNKLPEEQRLAVALVLVEGMSYKEAAEVLEIPMGTLTSRLARGRTALAAALAEKPGETSRELRRRNPHGLRRRRARRGTARGDRRGHRAGSGAGAPRRATPRAARRGWPAHFPGCWTSPFRSARSCCARRHARRRSCSRQRAAVSRAQSRARRVAPWRAREWIAMAASLVLGVLLSWRLLAPGLRRSSTAGEGALAGARRARARARQPARERTAAVKSAC